MREATSVAVVGVGRCNVVAANIDAADECDGCDAVVADEDELVAESSEFAEFVVGDVDCGQDCDWQLPRM